MSNLDPKGLQAAYDAYEKANPYDIFYPAVEAAIRAWEVHKTVPDEIAEVVQDLRDVAENLRVPVPNNAEGYVYYGEVMVVLTAANLLEQLAGLHPHDQE